MAASRFRFALRRLSTSCPSCSLDFNEGGKNVYYRKKGMLRIWVDNLVQSLKLKTDKKIIGKDHLGNVYYVVNPEGHSNHANQRGYIPGDPYSNYDNVPAEWMSWLRKRRKEPPTQEEIDRNLAMAELKQLRAAKLDDLRQQGRLTGGSHAHPEGAELDEVTASSTETALSAAKIETEGGEESAGYPVREEYETVAGEKYDTDEYEKRPKYLAPHERGIGR